MAMKRSEENPWRTGALGIWNLVSTFPATCIWVVAGIILATREYPSPAIWGMPTGLCVVVAIWAVAVGLGAVNLDPELAWIVQLVPKGDMIRWQERRLRSRVRRRGYEVGLALNVTAPVSDLEWALRAPLKRLPETDLIESEECTTLAAVQDRGASSNKILDLAEAYAPVLKSKPEWTRVRRPELDRLEVTWWKREPDDLLSDPIGYEDHESTQGIPVLHRAPGAIPIGVTERGDTYCLNIFGRQILTIGQSGSGKGSVIWSVMLGLGPWIKAGTVRVYGIDLKGGVELSLGREMFYEIAYEYEAAVSLLERVSNLLDARLGTLREAKQRKWEQPTPEDPLVLILIDEAGSLAYQAPDVKTKNEADRLLKRITSTGRAPGVAVLAALQDPRKESLAARDFFLDTVALRMSKADVAMALSSWAYESGAHVDRIPSTQPGTGYVINSETQEVERFRAFWVSDELIQDYAKRFRSLYGKEDRSK